MPNREQFKLNVSARMSADDSEAEIMLYGEICQDGWKWCDSDVSALDFDKALKDAKGKKKVSIRINSPGGDVFQATAMRYMLINSGIENLDFHLEGLCASAATLLPCVRNVIPNVKVYAAQGSMYMIHNPWTIGWGEARDFEKLAARLHQMEGDFHGIYAKHSGQTEEQCKAWMDEEKWFSAKQAVEFGFVDAMIDAEPVAACVSPRFMAAMKELYKQIPDTVNVAVEAAKETISNEAPAAAAGALSEYSTNKEEPKSMDMKDATLEQLRAENPALYDSIMNSSVTAERERIAEIDDLTPPGYEEMATKAKKDGISAMDFHKQIVSAQREKGSAFLANRKQELAKAAEVTGGAAEETTANATHKEIDDNAKEILAFTKQVRANADGSMY